MVWYGTPEVERLHGGVAVDGWGGISSPTTFAQGSVKIQLPKGARVSRALLLTGGYDGVVYNTAKTRYELPTSATPRGVILGPGAAINVPLEGLPFAVYANGSAPSWEVKTDVTAVVRPLLEGPAGASGNVVEIAIQERGDDAMVAPALRPSRIGGETLIVTFTEEGAPLRQIHVRPAADPGYGSGWIMLESPGVVNRCPAGDPRGENATISLSVTGNLAALTLYPNIPFAPGGPGGSDSTPGESDDGRARWMVGSFGGGANFRPVGTKGDDLSRLPTADGRAEDALWDVASNAPNGTKSLIASRSPGASGVLYAVVSQTTVAVAPDDADGDGVLDAVEGDCTVDTDGDHVADYLDLDSDGDGRLDSDPREAGDARTVVALPEAPDAGPLDAGAPDASPLDAGTPDASPLDAGTPDASGRTVEEPDAGGEAVVFDAGGGCSAAGGAASGAIPAIFLALSALLRRRRR